MNKELRKHLSKWMKTKGIDLSNLESIAQSIEKKQINPLPFSSMCHPDLVMSPNGTVYKNGRPINTSVFDELQYEMI